MSDTPPPYPSFVAALQVLQFVTSVVVVPGALSLIRSLKDIRDHLAKINGTIADLSRWRIDHEKAEEAHRDTEEKIRQGCQHLHQERLTAIADRVNDLWGRTAGDRRHRSE